MIKTFSGGLVYEYSQEPNNYGLVEIMDSGDIRILPDFMTLKAQLESLPEIVSGKFVQNSLGNLKSSQKPELPKCKKTYPNLEISKTLPKVANNFVEAGIDIQRGKYVELTQDDLTSNYTVFNYKGDPYVIDDTIEIVFDHMSGSELIKTSKLGKKQNCKYNNIIPRIQHDIFKHNICHISIGEYILTHHIAGSSLLAKLVIKSLVQFIILEFIYLL